MARAKLSSSFLAFGSNSDGAVSGASATKHVSIAATASTLDFDGASSADVALTGLSTASFSGVVTASTAPSQDGHLANKAYVDGVAQGLDVKPSCHCATTGQLPNINSNPWSYNSSNLTLTAGGPGVHPDIDGVALALNDIVLIKDGFASAVTNATGQNNGDGCNGIYKVTTLGAGGATHVYTRIAEMDATAEFAHGFTFVEAGTTNANAGFVCTAQDGTFTLDADQSSASDVTFTQFSGAGSIIAGDGLTKSGNTLSVVVDSTTIEINTDTLRIKDNAITNAKITDGTIKADKLDIDGSTDIGADLVDADLLIIDDGASGANRKTTLTRMKKFIYSAVSGDATVGDGGALTIAADAVESGMLNENCAGAGLAQHTDGSLKVVNATNGGISVAANDIKMDISNLSGLGAAPANADSIGVSDANDGNTTKKCSVIQLSDAVFSNVSGDATIAAGGALTTNKTMITGQTALGSASVAASDSFLFYDADADSLKKCTYQHLRDSIFANVSSDVTAAAGGAVTIGPGKVQGSMLNNNVISGQTELAHADIADADELMISDGGALKRVGVDSLRDHFFGVVSGDATVSDGGSLQIGTGLTVSNNAGTLAFTDTGVTLSVHTSSTIDQNLSSGQAVQFADVSVSSDAKWKDNIKQCKGGLDMINKMRGVSWRWNDKVPQAGKQASGIIAQELAHVMPYALNKAEAGLKVNYNCLWGPAIEAIKELSAKVKELEQKLQQHQHNETFYK